MKFCRIINYLARLGEEREGVEPRNQTVPLFNRIRPLSGRSFKSCPRQTNGIATRKYAHTFPCFLAIEIGRDARSTRFLFCNSRRILSSRFEPITPHLSFSPCSLSDRSKRSNRSGKYIIRFKGVNFNHRWIYMEKLGRNLRRAWKNTLGSINRNKPSKYPIDTDICHLCCDLLQIFSRKVGLLLSSVRFPQG